MNEPSLEERVTLLELLDRVLDKGVVLAGDITLSVADVDLVYVGLRVLLSSVETAQRMADAPAPSHPAHPGQAHPGQAQGRQASQASHSLSDHRPLSETHLPSARGMQP